MKIIRQIALAAGLAVMMPVTAMAQEAGQSAGDDIGSRLLAELTGQLDLPATNDLRSDSRRTYGQTGAQGSDKTTPPLAGPPLAGPPNPSDRIAQLPRSAPQYPQTERVQQVGQALPPPPLPSRVPAQNPVPTLADPKGAGTVMGVEEQGGKPGAGLAPSGYAVPVGFN